MKTYEAEVRYTEDGGHSSTVTVTVTCEGCDVIYEAISAAEKVIEEKRDPLTGMGLGFWNVLGTKVAA